jgi:hypothetical protein
MGSSELRRSTIALLSSFAALVRQLDSLAMFSALDHQTRSYTFRAPTITPNSFKWLIESQEKKQQLGQSFMTNSLFS